jgi:hypothetical protein
VDRSNLGRAIRDKEGVKVDLEICTREACRFEEINSKGKYEMTSPNKAWSYRSLILTCLLYALAMAGGASISTKAQDLVKGTFALSGDTRFGATILPAGHYIVSIQPVTSLTAAGSRVLVFVRPESKSSPVASMFAIASQESCDTSSGLTLFSDGNGLVARSLCLDKQGLRIDFDLSRSGEGRGIKAAVASARP